MPNRQEHHSFVKRNGLLLAFLAMMLMSLAGHAFTGWHVDNAEREQHGDTPQPFTAYLQDGQFLSTLFENWESEFLQMALFVLLTAKLRQKGAAESRPLDESEEDPKQAVPLSMQPWAARRGGAVRKLYEHSLSLALALLFLVSMVGHWINSWREHVEEQLHHGEAVSTLWHYLGEPQFWFESFQNWQSEFLAVVALTGLSIFLREKDSTESKDVEAPHSQTGT